MTKIFFLILALSASITFAADECRINAEIAGTKHDYQKEIAHKILEKKGYTISYGQYEYSLSAKYEEYKKFDYRRGEGYTFGIVFNNGIYQKSEVNVVLIKDGKKIIAKGHGKAERYIIASGYAVVRNSLLRAVRSLPNCRDLQ
jgi:hypothetical protein